MLDVNRFSCLRFPSLYNLLHSNDFLLTFLLHIQGDSHDVANAVVFLASDAARYVTSHALVVDGGITESTGT